MQGTEYTTRFYRDWAGGGPPARFRVTRGASDLLVLADRPLRSTARRALDETRRQIEARIAADPGFVGALAPREERSEDGPVVRSMLAAGAAWEVGPMAAVAGAVAEAVARRLSARGGEVIVENGGDVFARLDGRLRLALYAGEASPFRDRVGIRVDAAGGVAVCTSSASVGHSLSLGRADAVTAVARSGALADAAATAIANRVRGPRDVERVLAEEGAGRGLLGLVVCCGDRLGARGALELFDRKEGESDGTKRD